MKKPNQAETKASAITSVSRPPLRFGLVFNVVAIALACFGLSPATQAVSPPPDGGYPNANTAEGKDALFRLGIGFNNTAVGFQALFSNTKGNDNTSVGYGALYQNISGDFNTASGFQALFFNTTGKRNTAHGLNALYANTTGSDNTAIGNYALASNTAGRNNIGVGFAAGGGFSAGSNNIDIGNPGVEGDSNTIRIGDSKQKATFIAGVSGVTVASGVSVVVDTNGRLGTVTSSARYKDQIKPMDKASEAILALKPVTFHYKHEFDPKSIPQFGLVAEQVAKVNPDLVVCDSKGKVYTVRYEAVNAMLLNEFLKEHRKVEALETTVAAEQEKSRATASQQQKEITALTAALKAQAAQIQKVSERLEVRRAEPLLAAIETGADCGNILEQANYEGGDGNALTLTVVP